MTTVRFWFTKTGVAAYISLLDLQRVMQRAFKRARLPVWYTLGFNPHIYMTFSAPLSLGQESLVESLDIKTENTAYDWKSAADVLNACLPQGVIVQRVVPAQMEAASIAFARYEVHYMPQHTAAAKQAFAAYGALSVAEVEKRGKRGNVKQLDLKQYVQILQEQELPDGFTVTLLLPVGNTLTINPMLLLQFLETQFALPCVWGNLLRTALLTKTNEEFV
ncbi:MAG: TIGR03936 family radical SAM-associated protein [Ruthenibacterium sp.]